MAKKKRAKRETIRGLSVDQAAFDPAWWDGFEPAADADQDTEREHAEAESDSD